MSNNCPNCGTPLDEIPLNECRTHRIWRKNVEDSLRRSLNVHQMSQKVRDTRSFEELRDLLADWFQDREDYDNDPYFDLDGYGL